MEALNSNLTQEDLDKAFCEYENLKLLIMFENTKENKLKLDKAKKKLCDIIGSEEVDE